MSSAGELHGRRVLVTAGASGIGAEIARHLAAQGARVEICDVAEDHLAALAESDPGIGRTRADVSRPEDVDALFDAVADRMGGLDVLVNNAGIAGPTGAIETLEVADWERCLAVCLTGQFLCARRSAPLLKAGAGPSAMINISSAAGRLGYAYRTPYAAAKWGVIGLTKSLAIELGPEGVAVNAVLPGIVEGPRMEGVIAARAAETGVGFDEMRETYLQNVSLRRMVTAGEVAATVAFLASPAGAGISGQALGVCGNVERL